MLAPLGSNPIDVDNSWLVNTGVRALRWAQKILETSHQTTRLALNQNISAEFLKDSRSIAEGIREGRQFKNDFVTFEKKRKRQ